MTLDTWFAFFLASWIISLSPGPCAFSAMSAGMRFGYKKAIWNILGMQLATVLLLAIVAVGLGALLAASDTLFNIIKWLGVAYLVWLGLQQWRTKPVVITEEPDANPSKTSRELFWRGFLINASNPKAIIFMLAVLPQFINTQQPLWPQYMACELSLFITDFVVMSLYALLAARVLRALRAPSHIRWTNRVFGGLFVSAGALLAGLAHS